MYDSSNHYCILFVEYALKMTEIADICRRFTACLYIAVPNYCAVFGKYMVTVSYISLHVENWSVSWLFS